MFEISRPPLLVQPVDKKNAALFPAEDGYSVHPLDDEMVIVGYKEGWIMPQGSDQRAISLAAPLLMVKNSGAVTSYSSTTSKGYAHIFCADDGSEPAPVYRKCIFAPDSSAQWLFVENSITMIWFQYSEKLQFLGDSGHDTERFYYGKLLVRRFEITESIAPGFDKRADVLASCARLIMVSTTQLYSGGWNISDDSPGKCLNEIISSNKLERFGERIMDALKIASGAK